MAHSLFGRSLAGVACLVAIVAGIAHAARADGDIAGQRPVYSERVLSEPPNNQAIRTRMWVPEIDHAFVPQGVTVAEGSVVLSAYNSEGGPPKCRLYRIDRESLTVTATFDMPSTCGHAGGLAYAGHDRLFVADTWRLYEINLARAFDPATAGEAVVRTTSLRFPLRGSFLAYHDGALWIGEYKKPQAGKIYRVPLDVVATTPDPPGLSEEHATAVLDIAPKSQGATFDRDGFLWLSQSNSQAGALQKVDPKTGTVLAHYPAVAGIEDLGFDADGRLWTVCEAGSKRWHNWPTFYPLVFSIDVGALR